MIDLLQNTLHAFIPLFVAVDAFGTLPIFVGLTDGLNAKQKNHVIVQSFWTASVVGVIFILIGNLIFRFLSITVQDFMIAGGAILFCISITDIINPTHARKMPSTDLGSVPLGIPLMVGPAVLTTSLLLVPQCRLLPTIISVLVNLLIAATIFKESHYLIRFLGEAGSKALSKVMSLLLAAIAVMLIRNGIQEFIKQ
jgi:multiple antibiotic resistance protein